MSSTQKQIQEMKGAFLKKYDKNMEDVIKDDISGDYLKVILAICSGHRPDRVVDNALINPDLDTMYKCTEGKRMGSDTGPLIELVGSRSPEHLVVLNEAYKAKSKKGKTFLEIIAKAFSFNFKRVMECAFTDRIAWYAKNIEEATNRVGTKDSRLIINLMLPSQFEVQLICQYMKNVYKTDMITMLKKELSGNYEKIMIAHVDTCLKP
jgi:hypothetical protein